MEDIQHVSLLKLVRFWDLSSSCRRLWVSCWRHWERPNRSSFDAFDPTLRRSFVLNFISDLIFLNCFDVFFTWDVSDNGCYFCLWHAEGNVFRWGAHRAAATLHGDAGDGAHQTLGIRCQIHISGNNWIVLIIVHYCLLFEHSSCYTCVDFGMNGMYFVTVLSNEKCK